MGTHAGDRKRRRGRVWGEEGTVPLPQTMPFSALLSAKSIDGFICLEGLCYIIILLPVVSRRVNRQLIAFVFTSMFSAYFFHFYARQHICYSASLRQRRVRLSVCPSVCHTPVLCLAERKQNREMYTV